MEEITKKIEELIALAKEKGDNNTQIVLYGLLASQASGDDTLFATMIQDIIRNVMIPRIKDMKSSSEN